MLTSLLSWLHVRVKFSGRIPHVSKNKGLTRGENNKLFVWTPTHRGQPTVHTPNTLQLGSTATFLVSTRYIRGPQIYLSCV